MAVSVRCEGEWNSIITEFKHDVYGRRQTAKINSDFLFFSVILI